ncbi:MAG TPA: hypothetical protein PLZ24_14665 [Flavobacteriales bacterium]|nr:hypothetical protein [Flavobacteriales bacterium]
MEAVYPLGPHSKWSDNEIRYSLRSLEMYMPEVDSVMILGEKPDFLKGVDVMDVTEYGSKNTRLNSHLLEYSMLPMAERFLYMQDDFYLLGPMPYQEFHLDVTPERHFTLENCFNQTLDILADQGLSNPKDYELHIPVILERGAILEALEGQTNLDIAFRTLYFNLIGSESKPMADVKTDGIPEGGWCFSSSHLSHLAPGWAEWMEARFPTKSRWEK